jgi:hypothetical protein
MRRDIIGRFAVVGTLGKPSLYSFTACRRVVLAAALKTKSKKVIHTYLTMGLFLFSHQKATLHDEQTHFFASGFVLFIT